MTPLHVERVESRGRSWRVRLSDGQTYHTSNAFVASLCQRARELGQAVKVWSSAGWYYRTLTYVELVQPEQVA